MNQPRSLTEIASELAALRLTNAQTHLLKWQAEQDMAARLLDLTPADGWPGKNAKQRDSARAKALADDELHLAAKQQADAAYKAGVELDARIEALNDERRAAEWQLRARQVAALEARIPGDARTPDGQLFDEELQFVVEEQAWAENGQPVDYNESHPEPVVANYQMFDPDSDIPF
jgi:hypothetical protein